MGRKERVKTVFIYGVFICDILLLMKILFLSRVSLWELFSSQRAFVRSANLIPFHSIMEYLSGGSENLQRFAFGNVVGNIAIFVPLGVYLPLFKKNKKVLAALLPIFIISVLVELLQWLFGIGAADVDDIILNGLGGWIGILGYRLLLLLLRDEKKVRTTIAILSAVVGLPVLFYLSFMIKMRF